MKAKTRHGAGINTCRLNFYYEDYNGDRIYGHWDDAVKELGKDGVYLTANLYNSYFNASERVNSIKLECRPLVSTIKAFITETHDILGW